MEPIKELEDCVDAVFNIKEYAEGLDNNNVDLSNDALPDNLPTSTPEDILTGKEDLEPGNRVKIVDPDDLKLNGTEWIYVGPSEDDPDNMAKLVNPNDDQNEMQIDYSKIKKTEDDQFEDTEGDHVEGTEGDQFDDTKSDNPVDALNLNKSSLEEAVLSILERNTKASRVSTITECDDKACDKKACNGNCQSEDQKLASGKKRKFVKKAAKAETFEEMKTRKLTEARERGFSI